ncbi:MAG: LysR family transcriptional regulator [Alphaproteobacteria bacterium]|nr:LysR family transcriptional regulator [Alphaproteobacteria bacterium]
MPRPELVTLKQLRTIRAISQAGSLAGAAKLVHLTPPAVHTQLRMLESHLKCRLVDRGAGSETRLTPEGEALCRAEDKIEAILRRAHGEIEALRHGLKGMVSLGVVSTGKYFAPALVARIRDAYPDIEVALRVGNRDEIINRLRQGSIDMAIMGRPPRDPQVVATTVGDHPHVLIACPRDPLVGRKDVTPDELLEETFIAREQGSGTRILMSRFLDKALGSRPYKSTEMDSNETIKQAVIAGLGIAIISRHTVVEELKTRRLATIDFAGLPLVRQWFLIHPEASEPTGAAAVVHDFILAQEGRFLPV